ncbi:MAG: extracellular solute-binding protein [Gammaproteobacteria bacterium]|nr:extracellular solute-binding protein [Gammaproteobacteria bacterium]MDH3410846.1 extracellular solute-binding protein [Gammaproteobacteria bacterium]
MKIKTLLGAVVAGAMIGTAGVTAAADSELVIFDWAGYEDPEFFKSYSEKYGDDPTFAYFGDEEEAFQKLRSGFKADASHPCSQSIPKWREAGLLEPIDTSKIKAWGQLMPGLRDMEGFSHEGKVYFIPIDWGSTSVTYRTDKVPAADVASLQIFKDPKYRGRISIGDNVDDAYALGFLATGVTDWTKATDAQLKKASEFLREVHKNVRTYWIDGATLAQLMSSGEVLISWAWNETATTMAAEGQPVAMTRNTKEGSTTWVCGYVKMKNHSGSDAKFYDFINAWLEDRTADYIVSAWGYGHSNASAMAKMDPKVLQEKGFADLDKFRANTLWQAPVPPKLREKMIEEFEKIKAGF